MTVTITSTTDSAEAVAAATGSLAQEKVEEKSVSAEKAEETADESETSEKEEESDETEDKESEEESETKEADDKPKKKGKSGFKRKLVKKDQEIEYWKSIALREQKTDADKTDRTEQREANAGTSGEPNADDFASHAEYIAALTDWKVEQKLSERDKKAREKEIVSAHEKTVTTFTEKVQSFAKKHEDFQELMEEVDDVPMSIAIQEGIFASDKGPELMYELAKNRDEYARLCALPYNAALVELGKFEAKLSASADQKTETAKKQSKAPPPINPVKSKGAGASMKSPDDMDFQEYKKWRSANA